MLGASALVVAEGRLRPNGRRLTSPMGVSTPTDGTSTSPTGVSTPTDGASTSPTGVSTSTAGVPTWPDRLTMTWRTTRLARRIPGSVLAPGRVVLVGVLGALLTCGPVAGG